MRLGSLVYWFTRSSWELVRSVSRGNKYEFANSLMAKRLSELLTIFGLAILFQLESDWRRRWDDHQQNSDSAGKFHCLFW